MSRPLRLTQQTGINRVPTCQLRQREKAMEASKKRRALEGIPAPTGEAGKDPFNISNDQFHTKVFQKALSHVPNYDFDLC